MPLPSTKLIGKARTKHAALRALALTTFRPSLGASATMSFGASPSQTIYFGYGSNLWLAQMAQRCPTSTYLGVGRLPGYKWIINDRGYANVVELPSSSSPSAQEPLLSPTHDYSSESWGLVYSLLPEDERRLDRNEGVPVAYGKEWLECEFWEGGEKEKVDVGKKPFTGKKKMLVYVDRERVTEDRPKEEYVYRMNRGIEDAVARGVPEKYVKDVMRKFIPEDKEGEEESVEELALKQAREFVDENVVEEERSGRESGAL